MRLQCLNASDIDEFPINFQKVVWMEDTSDVDASVIRRSAVEIDEHSRSISGVDVVEILLRKYVSQNGEQMDGYGKKCPVNS